MRPFIISRLLNRRDSKTATSCCSAGGCCAAVSAALSLSDNHVFFAAADDFVGDDLGVVFLALEAAGCGVFAGFFTVVDFPLVAAFFAPADFFAPAGFFVVAGFFAVTGFFSAAGFFTFAGFDAAADFFSAADCFSAVGLLSADADDLTATAAALVAAGAFSSAANTAEFRVSVKATLNTAADFRILFIGTSPFQKQTTETGAYAHHTDCIVLKSSRPIPSDTDSTTTPPACQRGLLKILRRVALIGTIL